MSALIHRLDQATTPAADFNLALEELLLLQWNDSPDDAMPFLFFHESQSLAVVMGTGQKHAEVVDRAACERDGVPILRRCSGGGTVFHMPGVLWFSLGVPFDWLPQKAVGGIRATFADVLKPVCAVLRSFGVAAELRGTSDIAVPGPVSSAPGEPPTTTATGAPTPFAVTSRRKIAGTAQCRKQKAMLLHGTLLVSADLNTMTPYLPIPEKQPDYRAGRAHLDFLTTLRAIQPSIDTAALCDAIAAAWLEMFNKEVPGGVEMSSLELSAGEQAAIAKLAEEKYRTEAWTFRL